MIYPKALAGRPIPLAAPQPFATLGQAFDTLLQWQMRQRERSHLMRLDDRMLRDIGISREQAYEMTRRPLRRR